MENSGSSGVTRNPATAAAPILKPMTSAAQDSKSLSSSDHVVLSAKDVNVFYGDFKAVQNVDLECYRGQITALIGPSGCGKSTLLRCFNRMNDLIPGLRVEGKIWFHEHDLMDADVDVVAVRRRVGMVFQKPNPFPKSIYNNVAWGAKINGYLGDMDELVERCLRRAALWDEVKDKLDKSGEQLSGGQQQRLCIARTLAVEPEIILMDEPCSALDPISTAAVEDLMEDLKEDYTIVIVTHNMQQARRVSDMTACLMLDSNLHQGRRVGVVAEFSPTDKLFTNPTDPRTEAGIFAKCLSNPLILCG